MCHGCAPAAGWDRRRFLRAACAVTFGAGAGAGAGGVGAGHARTAAAAAASGSLLEIIPRRAWAGDAAPAGPVPPEPDVRFLMVHHTAHANDYAEADVPALLRGIHRFHTGPEKGWPDVAYNFVVDRFGGVWEARAGSLEGTVAGDATGGNQGHDQKCAFLGDHRQDLPTSEALGAMVALLALLADRHGLDTAPGVTTSFVSRGSNRHPEGTVVDTATITGHRTMSRTACPGDAVMGWVASEAPRAVTARRSPPTTATTGAATSTTTPTGASPERASEDTAPSTPGGAGDPVPWVVGGAVGAVLVGAALRLRTRT